MSTSTTPPSSISIDAFPIDPDSPIFVAKAVLASAAAGAAGGAIIGVAQRQNPFILGVNMSVNSGIAGLAFFATREYLVSPLLLKTRATAAHARRLEDLGHNRPEANRSLSEVRSERLLDSAIAGGLSGGGLSALTRGPRTLVPAAITASLVATLLQFSVNQVRVARLELLAKQMQKSEAEEDLVESSSTSAFPAPFSSSSSPTPLQTTTLSIKSTTMTSIPGSLPEEDTSFTALKSATAVRGDSPLSSRILTSLSGFLPVRKLSDEEYLVTLERKRSDLDKRLAEIDQQQMEMYEKGRE